MEKYDVLEPDYFYHIFNRGNNKETLFKEHANYVYFLKLVKRHLCRIADIYAYCLMKNHFHLLIKIKSESEIKEISKNKTLKNLSQPLSNLFNAYAKAFNNRYNREGSLFRRKYKRKRVEENDYLINLITYIHLNPVRHKVDFKYKSYPYSSFKSILSSGQTDLKRDEVFEIFDNKENFLTVHENKFKKYL